MLNRRLLRQHDDMGRAFENRHVRWAQNSELSAKVARELLWSSGDVLVVLGHVSGFLKALPLPGKLDVAVRAVAALIGSRVADDLVDMGERRLQ